MAYDRPRGVRDFVPDEMEVRDYVFDIIQLMYTSFSYRHVKTPSFEFLDLFEAKSGSDIREHLYTFEDKGGRMLCLRPEATASVARMYVQELRSSPKPLRLYYIDPMFRYEQPQKGRYREFWQGGCELIGVSGPLADAEIINLAAKTLKKLGINHILRISHIGILRELLNGLGLNEKSQNEIIHFMDDGKIDEVKDIISDASFLKIIGFQGGIEDVKKLDKYLPKKLHELHRDFIKTLEFLDLAGVEYTVDFSMARGLDYYSGIIFDVKVAGLGAQNQVAGGGRYDNLIKLFGGPDTPAVGFAFGLDRLIESMQLQGLDFIKREIDVLVITASEKIQNQAYRLASKLRNACPNLIIEQSLNTKKIAKALAYASNINAKYTLIIGENEIGKDLVTLKNMVSSEQSTCSFEEAVKILSCRSP